MLASLVTFSVGGDSPYPVSDGSFKSSRFFRSHDQDSEIKNLRAIKLRTPNLISETIPLPQLGTAIYLSLALEKQGLFCPFPAEYVPAGVRGIGNTMTSVTLRGVSLPLGPGRCSQWPLSLMCTLLTSSNTSVRSCKPHSCNNRQCLSFTWLPHISLASVSTAFY